MSVHISVDDETLSMLFRLRSNPGETLSSVIRRLVSDSGLAPIKKQKDLVADHHPGRYQVSLLTDTAEVDSLADLLAWVLRRLQDLDHSFLDKLSHYQRRQRRIVARTPEALFPGRADLAMHHSRRLVDGWWFGTNNSCRDVHAWLKTICDTAGLIYGLDLKVGGLTDQTSTVKPADQIEHLMSL